MDEWTIFGERLKAELTRQKISYRQFSEMSGITTTTVCRYVNSERIPRASEIVKTANVLDVTCDYLLGLSDDPHKTCKSVIFSKPEQKTGKWINGHWDGDSNFRIDGRGNCWFVRECSNCHEEIEGKPTKYCPNCGARMVKEGDTDD